MDKTDTFIVPPRLNRKHTVFGFTVWELMAMLLLLVLTFFSHKTFFIPFAAFVAVLSFRPPDHDRNALTYIRMLFRYFSVSPVYSLRECGD